MKKINAGTSAYFQNLIWATGRFFSRMPHPHLLGVLRPNHFDNRELQNVFKKMQMQMRNLFGLILAFGCVSIVAAQEATFHFTPPSEAVITTRSHSESVEWKRGVSENATESEDSLGEMKIHKIGEVYKITDTSRGMKNVVNGKTWINPLLPVVLEITNTCIVSGEGFRPFHCLKHEKPPSANGTEEAMKNWQTNWQTVLEISQILRKMASFRKRVKVMLYH